MASPIHTTIGTNSGLTGLAPGLDRVAADSLWSQLDDFSGGAGFSHWAYSAAATCPNAAPLLRVTTYPQGHVERCAERCLCASTLIRPYVERHARPAFFETVRSASPKSREFFQLLEINRQFRMTRGVLIPLTSYLGATGLLAFAFNGTDTQLQQLWKERSSTILQHAHLFHGEILRHHLHHLASNTVPPLTPRQRELLRQIAHGRTTAQIARAMSISIHTVNKHITAIKQRVGACSAAQAVVLAVQWGLL